MSPTGIAALSMVARFGQELGVVAEEDLDALRGSAGTLRRVDAGGQTTRCRTPRQRRGYPLGLIRFGGHPRSGVQPREVAKDIDPAETAVPDRGKQAEVDAGERDGPTSSEREELAAPRREDRPCARARSSRSSPRSSERSGTPTSPAPASVPGRQLRRCADRRGIHRRRLVLAGLGHVSSSQVLRPRQASPAHSAGKWSPRGLMRAAARRLSRDRPAFGSAVHLVLWIAAG